MVVEPKLGKLGPYSCQAMSHRSARQVTQEPLTQQNVKVPGGLEGRQVQGSNSYYIDCSLHLQDVPGARECRSQCFRRHKQAQRALDITGLGSRLRPLPLSLPSHPSLPRSLPPSLAR